MLKNGISYLASFDFGFNKVLEKLKDGVSVLTDSKKREIKRIIPFSYY